MKDLDALSAVVVVAAAAALATIVERVGILRVNVPSTHYPLLTTHPRIQEEKEDKAFCDEQLYSLFTPVRMSARENENCFYFQMRHFDFIFTNQMNYGLN
jgi:hypothetical protein